MKKKISTGIAVVGFALITTAVVIVGTGTSSYLQSEGNLFASSSSTSERESVSAATPLPTTSATEAPIEVPAGVPTSVPTEAAALSVAEMEATIPADWPADEIDNAKIWLQQQDITQQCMTEAGYSWSYEPSWLREGSYTPSYWPKTLPESEQAAGELALYGNTGGGADYHWDEAGCVGYAVHVTGQDDAN